MADRRAAKKVLVLHTNKNFDQQRTNWVMHLYLLEDLEQEKERELVRESWIRGYPDSRTMYIVRTIEA